MNYEQLLECAYEDVKVNVEEGNGRFEVIKVKGHHLGSRTVVSNFLAIASHIRRDPMHLMKFLAKETASSGEISNERLILSRRLTSKEINEKIDKYVCCFVLCPKCKKPDTEILTDNGKSFVRCLACGGRREIHKI